MEDQKVYMLNALWFKSEGGLQRYRKYKKAASPLIKKYGGRRLKSFVADRAVVGEFDADLVYFVEYPSWQAYKDYANSADYHKIAYLREESLERSLLIRCVRPENSIDRQTTTTV